MSCWVVPTVAAELWGIPLTQVMDQIARGDVQSQTEHGWLVVNVAPHTPDLMPGRPVGTHLLPPPTYTVLTEQECAALAIAEPDLAAEALQAYAQGNWDEQEPQIDAPQPVAVPADIASTDGDSPGADDESTSTFSWRTVRATRDRVARTRRPPPSPC